MRWLRGLLFLALHEAVEWSVHHAAEPVGKAIGKRIADRIRKPKPKRSRRKKK
jgi:hypothetical protein